MRIVGTYSWKEDIASFHIRSTKEYFGFQSCGKNVQKNQMTKPLNVAVCLRLKGQVLEMPRMKMDKAFVIESN